MNAFENILFWVHSDIEQTKNAIQISISKGQTHYELDDYLEDLLEIQEFLNQGIISHNEREDALYGSGKQIQQNE